MASRVLVTYLGIHNGAINLLSFKMLEVMGNCYPRVGAKIAVSHGQSPNPWASQQLHNLNRSSVTETLPSCDFECELTIKKIISSQERALTMVTLGTRDRFWSHRTKSTTQLQVLNKYPWGKIAIRLISSEFYFSVLHQPTVGVISTSFGH